MNNESYDLEDRKYVNPTLSRDEQLSFVNNFRDAQRANMEQVVRDTHNLGTDVPSIHGGLTGAEGIWKRDYVTPRVNSMVSSLQATAQAQALNDVLNNYQAQMKKRYNDAYLAAENRKNNSNGSNGGNSGGDDDEDDDLAFLNSDAKIPTGDGTDTVTGHYGNAQQKSQDKKVENLNHATGITGGGQLPTGSGRLFYLFAPDGSKSWVMFNNNGSGVGIDTPMASYSKDAGVAYINNLLSKGYRLSNIYGTRDVNPDIWRLVVGID